MALDPTNNIINKPTIPPADFSKIKSAPLSQTVGSTSSPGRETEPESHSWDKDPNQERREDRIKRENLLRYYEAEYSHAKNELDVVDRDLKELENKIRNEEKEIQLMEEDQRELTGKLKRIEKHLHRYRFELRSDKSDEMDKRIIQRRWQETVKDSERKLKKIRYGDWKTLRH